MRQRTASPERTGSPAFCRASLNYVTSVSGGETCAVEVDVLDGRRATLPAWPVCGFELIAHASNVSDWRDDTAIENVHYPEMAGLARAETGCDHVLIESHIKRDPEQAAVHPDLGPITFVHSDFAPSYGELIRSYYAGDSDQAIRARTRAALQSETIREAGRLLILQFWRNIGPPTMDLPIAFCDARTVSRDDLVVLPVSNYADSGFDFDALGVVAPADATRHRWYTFPGLTPREVVAFRTFDTDLVSAGGAFWTPHSAFRDPHVPEGVPSRRSIELRAICLFD